MCGPAAAAHLLPDVKHTCQKGCSCLGQQEAIVASSRLKGQLTQKSNCIYSLLPVVLHIHLDCFGVSCGVWPEQPIGVISITSKPSPIPRVKSSRKPPTRGIQPPSLVSALFNFSERVWSQRCIHVYFRFSSKQASCDKGMTVQWFSLPVKSFTLQIKLKCPTLQPTKQCSQFPEKCLDL